MSKLRFQITMTLDGYIAGPNQSVEHGLGEGADHIHDWALKLKSFREMHGDEGGGETGTNDDVLREAFENVGATIMGRNMFWLSADSIPSVTNANVVPPCITSGSRW